MRNCGVFVSQHSAIPLVLFPPESSVSSTVVLPEKLILRIETSSPQTSLLSALANSAIQKAIPPNATNLKQIALHEAGQRQSPRVPQCTPGDQNEPRERECRVLGRTKDPFQIIRGEDDSEEEEEGRERDEESRENSSRGWEGE